MELKRISKLPEIAQKFHMKNMMLKFLKQDLEVLY